MSGGGGFAVEKLGPGDPLGQGGRIRGSAGTYRLLARLGAGGMGQVYLARSDRGRTVAVKVARRELAQREEFRARFRQEVQAARRVGGHWTAPVLDADTEAAVPWVATGYVAGPSLQQVVGHDHGPLPERSVRVLAAGLAGALRDIHAAGLVHRDLKPSNVLVTIDGPRVIDFGIARALESVTDGGLTRTGALVGSPGFMAPEQVRGERITPACDVFCLGSVLAYAATGALPFGSADSGVHALMFRIAQEEPDLRRLPEGLADLVGACLRKDPAARPTVEEIIARTGAEDTVADGRLRDPWLPSALVAQLGRHAVRLLDTENPADPEPVPVPDAAGEGASAGGGEPDEERAAAALGGPALGEPAAPGAPAAPEAPAGREAASRSTPEQAQAPAGTDPAPAAPSLPGEPGGGAHPPVDHLPTLVAGPAPAPGQTPPPGAAPAVPPNGHASPYGPARPAAYGYPHQAAGGWAGTPGGAAAQHPYGGLGATPPYGPPPIGSTPPYGPPPTGATPPYGPPPTGSTPPYGPRPLPRPEESRGGGRSTAMLVAVALVVALGAGGSVYALMRGAGGDDKGGPGPDPTLTATRTTDPGPSPTTSASGSPSPTNGVVPAAYLGTWTATIDNAYGPNPRRLTLGQGEVGDTVLTLVADGPTDSGGTYHCVFRARLTRQPGSDGPLEIGPSTVTVGKDSPACRPGQATQITLLPNGMLRRVNTSTGEEVTYSKD
ncbi:serine/threonine-protein kinase [Streptomyces mexicanus]|uniref:serine/threonine-protein kinase n=1 Tax=Streptomyces mexicanus TaxID=178566 RepID=UPI0036CB9CEB